MSLELHSWLARTLVFLCLIGIGQPEGSLAAGPPATAETVVVIVVDGLRPDAIKPAKAPNLDNLIRHGATNPARQR
jgi:predicted AlkP superfamily pyrophosphatase or phosphodiesterase